MSTGPRICCAGEVMIEFAATGKRHQYSQGFAGDSYNTAIYLAREGLQVDYLTRLGDDALSGEIIEQLCNEGVGVDAVVRCAGRQPGLYLINNDADGERHFSYWRSRSPARELFDQPLPLQGLDAFYFTGITLATCRNDIKNLVALIERLRTENCSIIFDPNFRPGLWDTLQQARNHYQQVLGLCDILLPGLDDDRQLWGVETIEQCREHYLQYAPRELVIKGDNLTTHAWIADNYTQKQARQVPAIDTTGAGDSFNAGYLAARLQGLNIDTAIETAQQLAARVVQHRGAVIAAGL